MSPEETSEKEQYANWKTPETGEKKWGEYVEDPNKVYYHGSPDDYDLDPEKTDSTFGGELYVTDDITRADKHAVGENAKIHELNLRLKKVFEFDKLISIAEANELMQKAGFEPLPDWEWNSMGQDTTTMGTLHGKLFEDLKKRMSEEVGEDATGATLNKKENDLLRQLGYDAIRSAQSSDGENVWRLLHRNAYVQKR
jgi:hypothetical protein